MRSFAKLIAPALAATVALFVAVPAQADPGDYGRNYDRTAYYGHQSGNWGQAQAIRQRLSDLERMVERNDYRDSISSREAAGLRRDVWQLRSTYRAMSRDGLSVREARHLTSRINFLRDRLHHERFDRDGRRW